MARTKHDETHYCCTCKNYCVVEPGATGQDWLSKGKCHFAPPIETARLESGDVKFGWPPVRGQDCRCSNWVFGQYLREM